MVKLNSPNGILMPTIESFYERTMLAMNTQPQEGKFFFLPGKGWGTEIAIRGQILGRKKHSKYLHTIPFHTAPTLTLSYILCQKISHILKTLKIYLVLKKYMEKLNQKCLVE